MSLELHEVWDLSDERVDLPRKCKDVTMERIFEQGKRCIHEAKNEEGHEILTTSTERRKNTLSESSGMFHAFMRCQRSSPKLEPSWKK